MTDRFLVLGSNSFSGAHFVRHLLQLGYEVDGASRSEEPDPVFLPYRWLADGQDRFRFRRIDLNHDLDRLMEWINARRPRFIVNFAGQGMVAESWSWPEQWYQTNVVAQVRLHERLRRCDFLEKYVHVSTPEAYGSTDGWTREHFRFAPSTPYAASHAACDLHLMTFHREYGFPVVFTRAANVYGPGQQLYRIVPRALLFARLGGRLQLHGGGQSVRSFIHIDDVADATRRVAQHGASGQSFHISTRSTVTIRELVEKVCEMTGVRFDRLAETAGERRGKDQAYLLDSAKLREELGWQERIDLAEGLAETLDWVDRNLARLQELPRDYQHKP